MASIRDIDTQILLQCQSTVVILKYINLICYMCTDVSILFELKIKTFGCAKCYIYTPESYWLELLILFVYCHTELFYVLSIS